MAKTSVKEFKKEKENIYWNGKGNYEKTLYGMLFN